jgi:non-reducing end alpha-L-arabinofuranosidase
MAVGRGRPAACQARSGQWCRVLDVSAGGQCVDVIGDDSGTDSATGTKVELWDCNGVGGQKWVQQANGSLLNPQSGLCLDDPSGNTANGTQLQIFTCNAATAEQFALS